MLPVCEIWILSVNNGKFLNLPVPVYDMTELDIGEDADSWYADVKLQLPASAP